LVGNYYGIPSVDAIKNAIYTYGPITAGICAGSAMSAYRGGIFSTDECAQTGINHGIALVGWNDAENTWVLRNSWGTGWGESAMSGGEKGYMRIVRGTSQVGYAASYITYSGTPSCYDLTTAPSPSGSGGVAVSPVANCNGTQYMQGTVVTISAVAGCGHAFQNWSGDASGAANPTTVTMDRNKSVTANFSAASSACFYQHLPVIHKSRGTTGWTTILSDNLEGAFPGIWTLAGNNGYTWGKRNCQANAGSNSGWGIGGGLNGASKNCGANYPHSADSWMIYGPFSLAGATAADFKYKLWLNTESGYDFVCRLASTDGNNLTSYGGTCTSGTTNGAWTDKTLDLANIYSLGNLLGQPNVWVALVFYSDSSVTFPEGGHVDDIVLRQCLAGATCPAGASPQPASNDQTSETPYRTIKQPR
jgi:hypothetical protein